MNAADLFILIHLPAYIRPDGPFSAAESTGAGITKICIIDLLFGAFFLDTPGAFLYIPLLIPKTYTVYEIIISPK
jgi:hypothetical protein